MRVYINASETLSIIMSLRLNCLQDYNVYVIINHKLRNFKKIKNILSTRVKYHVNKLSWEILTMY
jgi:hypothetical protein